MTSGPKPHEKKVIDIAELFDEAVKETNPFLRMRSFQNICVALIKAVEGYYNTSPELGKQAASVALDLIDVYLDSNIQEQAHPDNEAHQKVIEGLLVDAREQMCVFAQDL